MLTNKSLKSLYVQKRRAFLSDAGGKKTHGGDARRLRA